MTKVQEIPIARYTWEILKPLECTFDAIKIERHLPTQFQLLPPKAETRTAAQHTDHNVQSPVRDIASSVMSEPAPPYHSRQSLSASTFPFPSDRSRSVPTLSPPRSPGIAQGFNTPLSDHFPSEGSTFMEKSSQDEVPPFIGPHPARRLPPEEPLSPAPFSPDTVGPPNPFLQQSVSAPTPDCVHFPKLDLVSPSVPLEKRRSKWRSKLTMSRKESTLASGDSSSLSSSTLESQKLEEIGLDSLLRASKAGVRAKFPKNVNICLSQNSTFALLWTQPLIHIWDVGASGPNMVRSIVTQSSCLLAAVTKVYLAYVIGTRDQKLTVSYEDEPLFRPIIPLTLHLKLVTNSKPGPAIGTSGRVSHAVDSMVQKHCHLPKGELRCSGLRQFGCTTIQNRQCGGPEGGSLAQPLPQRLQRLPTCRNFILLQ